MPTGGLGAQFVAYLKTTPFDDIDRADLDAMKQAIEEGCERTVSTNTRHSRSSFSPPALDAD